MPYYLAEIRLNITSKDAKSERKVKKRLVARLVTILLACLLVLTPILIVPAAVGSEQPEVIEALEDLCEDVSELPEGAAEGHKNTLCNKIRAVIHQIESGADEGAVNKLSNDVKNSIVQWVNDQFVEDLLNKVDDIIYKITDKEPPVIVDVWRDPITPAYNETVTVTANVTDEGSGVELVILSYWNGSDWTNVTMTIEDMLYMETIPALPNGTTVQYKILARDYAENWADSDVFSYTVGAPPPPVLPPVAKFTESAETVYTGETIFFNASSSYDPDGGIIVDYEWDFGDGAFANNVTTSHSYADDGVYTVTLIVTDDEGTTNSTSAVKTVLNRPPVAHFNESAEIVDTDVVITFDASDSDDLDGEIVSYYWDFGDGVTEIYVKGVNLTVIASHSYADNGTYTVTLTVTDDDGASASEPDTKTVLNRPPVAEFTQSVTTVKTGQTTTFDAGDSYDPDGTIESYVWDFGDGKNTTGVEVSHAYDDDGSYTVTLTVTDDDGAINSTSITKTVSNRPPTASFTQNATTVDVGEAIHFDASDSSDPDGNIVEYFWVFGDGTNETGMTVDHVYTEGENYTVTLTVTDDDGATSSDDVEITVNAPVIPWALYAAVALGIAAAAATIIYLWYRRRKRKKVATAKATKPPTKPAVTLYLPAKMLAEHNKSSQSE